MAFDAGAIEATLTLNRNPFTAGLAAAKAQVDQWKRRNSPIEIDVKVNLREAELRALQAKLKQFGAMVARATAEVVVKGRAEFDKLLFDLKWFDRRKFTATIDVDAKRATADVIAFRALLSSLNDQTVNLRANTRGFGNDASSAFDSGTSHFKKLAIAVIAGLPVIASAFTATVGAVGALASGLLIAGLGAGALAIVAVPAIKSVWKAANEGQEAVNKLPPALQAAGNAALGMNKEIEKLKTNTQLMVGVGLANWFKAGATAVSTLTPLVSAAAVAFGNAGAKAVQFFNSPWWKQFVDFLSKSIGPAVDMLFRGIFALIQIVGNLTEAFWKLGGSQILEMITKGLEDFAKWTERIGENKTFQEFMDAAVRSLPVVGKLIGDLIVFIFKLAVGLEPLGTLIIRVLNGIFDAVNSLPPEVLAALAFGFAAVWAAIALGAGGPVAIAIGVLVGLGVIFSDAYAKSQTLRDGINDLIAPIRDWFIPLATQLGMIWDQYVIPAWDRAVAAMRENLIPVFEYLWHMFVDNVLPALSGLAVTFTETLLPAILDFWAAIQPFVAWVLKAFGEDIIYALQLMVSTFDGAFKTLAGLLNVFTGIFTGDWTKFTNGITQITQGFWTIVAGIFGLSLDQLRAKVTEWDNWMTSTWHSFWDGITGFFRGIWDSINLILRAALDLMHGNVSGAADKIGQVWRKIANLFATPINWVFEHVIGPPGGLAGAWNTVMTWIGQPQLSVRRPDPIPGFAIGGTLPGYAPRQDSILAALSPGESVMVPEWTRAVGGRDAVAKMNQAAMSGGLYYEGNPRTYGLGGVIPHFAYGGVAPHVAAAGDEIQRVFGRMPGGIGGVGARANASDHPSGFALDFMVLNNRGLGDRIANYFFANWGRLATKYIIWLQRIASSPGAWRGMANRGSPTANHMDHVHASFLGGPGGGGGGGVPIPMVSWWSLISGQVTNLLKGLFSGAIPGLGGPIGKAISSIPGALIDKVIDALRGKLESLMTVAGSAINTTAQGAAANPLSGMGTSDRGAIIPPGASTLFNATGKPEPLTNLDVYERMKPAGLSVEDVISLINAHNDSGAVGAGSGDVYNVMLPERASVRELADQLDFKRRVVRMGRYSR